MATIADDLAQSITKALTDDQLIISNLDKVVYGPGNITITRKDGSQVTGPSWPQMLLNSPNPINVRGELGSTVNINTLGPDSANRGVWTRGGTVGLTVANGYPVDGLAGVLEIFSGGDFGGMQRYTTKYGDIYVRVLTAAWNATSMPWGPWSLTNEEAPQSDVHVPLTDDMAMPRGQGAYDRINFGSQYAELATRSATFIRATGASYINKIGKMIFADVNEPRFEKPGLLMESMATNLYPFSETFSTSSLVTTTPNAATCPTGEMLMTKFTESTTTSEHYSNDRNIPLTAGSYYCFSLYVKDDTANRLLYLRVASGSTTGCFFDIRNETITLAAGSASNAKCGFEKMSGGIYRVWVSFTATATQSTVFRIQMSQGMSSAQYAGDGVSGFYGWGAQVEEGIAPSSYIRNGGSATNTRTADEWWVSTDNAGYQTLADYFERTVAFELNVKVRPYTSYVEVMQVRGSSNDIICRLNSNDAATIISYRSSSGPTLAIPGIESLAPSTFAHRLVGNALTNYFNGKSSRTDSVPVSLTGVPTRFGPPPPNSASKFVYHIKNFRVWHRALTENQIRSLR